MHCMACGQELPEEAAFCWKCGTAVGQTGKKPVVAAVPTPPKKALARGARGTLDEDSDEARGGEEDEDDAGDLHWGEELDEDFSGFSDSSGGSSWGGDPAEREHGPVNRMVVCPHCQRTGGVRTQEKKQKKGVSGGKATAALLTGGVSMLATGLSRKEWHQVMHCDFCGSTWTL